MSQSNPQKIRLGICMAGAVSAGAYTAGVIDYLIETLERWEQQKVRIRNKQPGQALSAEEALIPMHDVVVEVLSGASAGGMTAAVLAYAFNDDTYVTKRNGSIVNDNYNLPETTDQPTKLYTAWIDMVDDNKGGTFKKLMDTQDVLPISKMKSLLNSQPIDDIAAKAIPASINFNPPGYISPHLSVILSVTNLEGIPVDIRFSNIAASNPTRNVLKMHSGFLHYQFNEQALNIDFPAEKIDNTNIDHLAVAAKATGAFPFGLANRKIVVNNKFFEGFKQQLKKNYNINVNLDLLPNQDYVFNAVDGGAINNEPLGSTVKILNSKKQLAQSTDKNYVILIDPFPSVTNARQTAVYTNPGEYNLLQQAFKIFGAFKNQSAYKQEDLLSGLEMDDNRFLIYPAKKKYYFLASGLIGGFSGFLKKSFRSHDYQLGRKNCQAFLRYYFGEPVEKFETTAGITLSAQQKKQWCYNTNYGKKDAAPEFKMPFIPDMLLLNAAANNEIAVPEYDGITANELNEINGDIKKRVAAIIDNSYDVIKTQGKKINKVVGWALALLPGYIKGKIVNALTGKVEHYLHETLYPQTIKQDELVNRFAAVIESKGSMYQKIKGVYATVANGGELVVSKTSTGFETTNVASKGDYIITNDTKALEKYILKPDKFNDRYVLDNGNYYKPNNKAQVHAIPINYKTITDYNLTELEILLTNQGRAVYIEGPWKASQLLCIDDYLVCPPSKSEVYRIAEVEFKETYVKM